MLFPSSPYFTHAERRADTDVVVLVQSVGLPLVVEALEAALCGVVVLRTACGRCGEGHRPTSSTHLRIADYYGWKTVFEVGIGVATTTVTTDGVHTSFEMLKTLTDCPYNTYDKTNQKKQGSKSL